MVTIEPSSSNLLVIKLTGKITHDDYQSTLVPAIKNMKTDFSEINVCAILDEDFDGYELQASFDDAKLGIEFWKSWNKIALIGAPKWLGKAAEAMSILMPGAIRGFNDLDEAKSWINKG